MNALRTLLILFSLIVIAALFQQGDLSITAGSSRAILEGNIFGFYDANYSKCGAYNDYLPIVYYIFAAWNSPEFIANGVTSDSCGALVDGLSGWALIWNKLLLITLYYAACINFQRFISLPEFVKSDGVRCLLLGPISLYSVVIFGQYDVIGLYFISCGILFYGKRRYTEFALIFGLGFCVKFFAALPFFPLLLLRVKRAPQILMLSVLFFIPAAIQIYLYNDSHMFNERVLYHLASKFLEKDKAPSLILYLFILIYSIICIFFMLRSTDKRNELILVCGALLAPFSALFSLILWHPQWLLYASFFYSIYYILYPTYWLELLVVELFGFVSFVAIVVNRFYNNADQAMLKNGLLKSIIGEPIIQLSDLFRVEHVDVANACLIAYMMFPVLISLFRGGMARDE